MVFWRFITKVKKAAPWLQKNGKNWLEGKEKLPLNFFSAAEKKIASEKIDEKRQSATVTLADNRSVPRIDCSKYEKLLDFVISCFG